MNTKTAFAALAAIAALGIACVVHAATPVNGSPDRDTVALKVSTDGLNLASETGAEAALKRIRDAARNVCTGELDALACRVDTVERAVAALNSPVVTALNEGRDPPHAVFAQTGR